VPVSLIRIEHPSWKGFFPAASAESLLREHVFRTWVSGISLHDDVLTEDFEPLSRLRLVPEPDNPHDARALSVMNVRADKQAGYVPASFTAGLDLDIHRIAYVLARLMTEKRACVGLQILVSRNPVNLLVLDGLDEPPSSVSKTIDKELARASSAHTPPDSQKGIANPIEQMRAMLEGQKPLD
jgi:hypothetical protein